MLNPVEGKVDNNTNLVKFSINIKNAKKRNLQGFSITIKFDERYLTFDNIDKSKRTTILTIEDLNTWVLLVREKYNEVKFEFNHPDQGGYEPIKNGIRDGTLIRFFLRKTSWPRDLGNLRVEFKDIIFYTQSSGSIRYSDHHNNRNQFWHQQRHDDIIAFNSWVVKEKNFGDIDRDSDVTIYDLNAFTDQIFWDRSRFQDILKYGKYLNLGSYYNGLDIHILRLMDLYPIRNGVRGDWIIDRSDLLELIKISNHKSGSDPRLITRWIERQGFEKKTPAGAPNILYYYGIQNQDLNKTISSLRISQRSKIINPNKKITARWADLKSKK